MILTPNEIKEALKSSIHATDIREGIKLQNLHKVHVTGEGYKDVLKDIIGVDRALEYGKRELKQPITKFLTKKIKDELSRWKNTQGTRKSYDFGADTNLVEEFRKLLNDAWKDGGMDAFGRFINDALYTDFGGFVLVEMPASLDNKFELKDGIRTKKTGKPYIVFKALEEIHDFRLNGKKVEYLVLKMPDVQVLNEATRQVVNHAQLRVIDDSGDYIYRNIASEWVEDTTQRLPNKLGYVPAIQLSDVRHTPLRDHLKTSHIDQTIPLLDDYMTRHAEHVTSELIHSNPLLAIKGQKCNYTNPTTGQQCSNGKIFNVDGIEVNCPQCGGVGATAPKNANEVIIVPEVDKTGKTYNPGMVAQYIVPPTEILEHQSKELESLEHRVIYSGTGIKSLVKSSIQTATEIVLNLKPLEDKISVILDNIEEVETFATNCIGKIVYEDKYKGCKIHYGRKLNVRDENLILDEIEQSKRNGLPQSDIRMLYIELYETRYRNSPVDLERALMLLDLEPFATLSIKEVESSTYIGDEDKWMKMNFDDYIDQFENEHAPIHLFKIGEDMPTRIKKIKKILSKYNAERKSKQDRSQEGSDETNGDPKNSMGNAIKPKLR